MLQVSVVIEEFGVVVESLLIKFGKNVVGQYQSLDYFTYLNAVILEYCSVLSISLEFYGI